MPLAWRLARLPRGLDAVISSSHACAKAVRGADGVPHLCYCHTPMRYAWDFEAERRRFPAPLRPLVRAGMVGFRAWDRPTAAHVDRFVANSTAVADRIRRFYGRRPSHLPACRHGVLHARRGAWRRVPLRGPARQLQAGRPGRARFEGPHRLLVVGEGHLAERLKATAPSNVRFLANVDDAALRDLYRSARALVYPADEDFGIVMAEAQACGTPVVALAAGGALDIVRPGETGWHIEGQSVDELRRAVERAATEDLDPAVIREARSASHRTLPPGAARCGERARRRGQRRRSRQ